jgi:hypothetical protein
MVSRVIFYINQRPTSPGYHLPSSGWCLLSNVCARPRTLGVACDGIHDLFSNVQTRPRPLGFACGRLDKPSVAVSMSLTVPNLPQDGLHGDLLRRPLRMPYDTAAR